MLITYPHDLICIATSQFSECVKKIKFNPDKDYTSRIYFSYSSYTGDILNDERLINKEILIKYNRYDLRELDVYSLDGLVYFGKVYAPKAWMNFPFTHKTRKLIRDLVKQGKLEVQHNLGAMVSYLSYLFSEVEEKPKLKKTRELLRTLSEMKFKIDDINFDNIIDTQKKEDREDKEDKEDKNKSKSKNKEEFKLTIYKG